MDGRWMHEKWLDDWMDRFRLMSRLMSGGWLNVGWWMQAWLVGWMNR